MTQIAPNTLQTVDSSPHIVDAERLGQGVFISFDTGEFGFYSAILLHEMLPRLDKYKGDFSGWPGF